MFTKVMKFKHRVKIIERKNHKIIENKESNQLLSEIYKLKYNQKRLEEFNEKVKIQKLNLDKLRNELENIKDEIKAYKIIEEDKRNEIKKEINEQGKIIKMKEEELKTKREQIRLLEEDYKNKLSDLQKQYNEQIEKKSNLDKEIDAYKKELLKYNE